MSILQQAIAKLKSFLWPDDDVPQPNKVLELSAEMQAEVDDIRDDWGTGVDRHGIIGKTARVTEDIDIGIPKGAIGKVVHVDYAGEAWIAFERACRGYYVWSFLRNEFTVIA